MQVGQIYTELHQAQNQSLEDSMNIAHLPPSPSCCSSWWSLCDYICSVIRRQLIVNKMNPFKWLKLINEHNVETNQIRRSSHSWSCAYSTSDQINQHTQQSGNVQGICIVKNKRDQRWDNWRPTKLFVNFNFR